MRSPRRVTLAPIDWPSRTLKPAMDFLALVTSGFWPVIWVRSRTAPSSRRASRIASPMPMFTTTLSGRGTCMMLPSSSSSLSRCCSSDR
jgi:hypothetical protein